MDKLRSVVEFLAKNAETAADETFLDQSYLAPDSKDLQIAYYALMLRRSNAILDKNKDAIFGQVLDLRTRAHVEQAARAYDKDYLLSLPLSLESICELAQSLIGVAKANRVPPPTVWVEVSKFNMLEQAPPDREYYPRKVADI